uniref:Radical SAM superfamily protein n=1 Tax=viral metagenome TaxID=1070528 RepID=A0A6H1ZRX7_9ZZZZ
MTRDRMYQERAGNISAFRGCSFGCTYCAFRNTLRRSSCEKCRIFEPHAHLEVLDKTPPKTKPDEFITIGLTGDISFMDPAEFIGILGYCLKWFDRTFLIQSKNPDYFGKLMERTWIPNNVIIGTTIETTTQYWDSKEQWEQNDKKILSYSNYSKAPHPSLRYRAMVELDCRKMITIEPIMDFNFGLMVYWMKKIRPEYIYIGFNSNNKIKLPEPSLMKTQLLIEKLSEFTEVRTKLLRKAW